MLNARTIAGHSFPLNVVCVVLNLAGLGLTAMAFHEQFAAQKILFASLGIGTVVLSAAGMIILKGRLMMATVSRILAGSVLIVSGLIKANDPVGFSYKLEEYFQDGALAYRIKEWFGSPGFSLEFLIDSALSIAIIICVIEIVLGVLLLLGGKMKWTANLLLLMMLFFTFLTWHTANCNPEAKFTDRDTYSLSDPDEAQTARIKMDQSKSDKNVRIISKNDKEVVVEQRSTPQCVSDCGCFGDAMKGSVGRSLTPSESLWKDIILLYLTIWIFIAQRIVHPNSIRQNWRIIPWSLLLTGALSWVFDWYFPVTFTVIALLSALWIYRSGGRFLGNHFAAALLVTLWCSLFVWYVLEYDPLKDYRPYAVGTDLRARSKGNEPFDFNPYLNVEDITRFERDLPFVADQLKGSVTTGLRLKETATGKIMEIPQAEYHVESYPPDKFRITDTIEVENPEFYDVNARDYILKSDKILVVVAKRLDEMDRSVFPELKNLQSDAKKAGVPVVFVTNAYADMIRRYRGKYGFTVPTFINDETELKVISRSSACLLVLKNGKIAGKYTANSLPDFHWINKNLFK